jgi:hypothetical protein
MCISNWESAATIAAIVSTAGFFAWKVIAGWLIINLEIDLLIKRQLKPNGKDWLSIDLVLRKGATDGLWLKDIVVRIYDDKKGLINELKDIQEYKNLAVVENKLNWNIPPSKKRKYTIAPGEVFRYGAIEEVDADKPLIIEGAVYGKRPFWRKGFQWRASVTSLPSK